MWVPLLGFLCSNGSLFLDFLFYWCIQERTHCPGTRKMVIWYLSAVSSSGSALAFDVRSRAFAPKRLLYHHLGQSLAGGCPEESSPLPTTTLIKDPAISTHFGPPLGPNFLHCKDFVRSILQPGGASRPTFPPPSLSKAFLFQNVCVPNSLSICLPESLTRQVMYVYVMQIPDCLDYCSSIKSWNQVIKLLCSILKWLGLSTSTSRWIFECQLL